MDVYAVLKDNTTQILDGSEHVLRTAHFTHYENWGEQLTRASLGDLYEHIMVSLHHRDLAHIVNYCESIAERRFTDGFELVELQTTFNALEQTMWRHWVDTAPAQEVAQGVGMLSAVLGAGKDAAARTYVRLASQRHAPAIDVNALAEGTV